MMEKFCICSVQSGSHQLHVDIEHVKRDRATEKLNVQFNLNLNCHMLLMATVLDSVGLAKQTGPYINKHNNKYIVPSREGVSQSNPEEVMLELGLGVKISQ